MGDIRLGCYTAPWGPDGLIQAIDDISAANYEGLECPAGIVQRYEDRLHVFEEILNTSNLSLIGLLQGVNLLDRDEADLQVERAVNAARFVSAAGRGFLTICHNGETVEKMTDEHWATAAAIIEEIGERSAEFQIPFCFLPRSENLIASEKEISRIMAMTNPDYVSLALDTAEVTLAGGSPQRVIKQHADRIRSIRFRDASASKRRSRSTSNRPGSTPQLGRGAVNFEAISKALIQVNYGGWITVDVSGDQAKPAEAVHMAYRFILRKSGLFPV